MSQLPADCLNDIFEFLKDDIKTLYSCMLVNHLWCEVSVRIFWIDIRNYNTLIACLPNDSKEILYNNKIHISVPTSKPPIFNYSLFCKVLVIDKVYYKIGKLLIDQKFISLQNIYNNKHHIAVQEICKMIMNQSSLKSLIVFEPKILTFIPFIHYPGAKDCLKNISEFRCNTNISSEFFCQLSKICHNILLLDININNYISNELIDLISIQKNLKYVNITSKLIDTFPSLITTNLPNTLFKLKLCSTNFVSLLFIIKFTNLQELELSFDYEENFGDFERLKFAIFPKLQILKIKRALPESGLLIKFLENNGKYLKELHLSEFDGYWGDNSLNLSIAKFCTNLKKLTTGFRYKELETLKIVFNSCKYLESIKMWCGGFLLSEKEALKAVVKYSHENFSELIIYHVFTTQSRLFPEELESFFISWTSRVPLKSISLIVTTNHFYETSLDKYDENMEVIRKYIQLGVIEKFEVRDLNDDEYD